MTGSWGRLQASAVYLLVLVVGLAAFLYPFWLPSEALPATAHSGDAPLVAALVALLAVVAVTLELHRGTMRIRSTPNKGTIVMLRIPNKQRTPKPLEYKWGSSVRLHATGESSLRH